MPKKIRTELGTGSLILTRGYENCIFGWQLDQWEKSNQASLERPVTDLEARNIRRYLFSAAEVCMVDKLGRIVVPEQLSKHSGLGPEVVLIGAGDHLEIWDKHAWTDYLSYLERE